MSINISSPICTTSTLATNAKRLNPTTPGIAKPEEKPHRLVRQEPQTACRIARGASKSSIDAKNRGISIPWKALAVSNWPKCHHRLGLGIKTAGLIAWVLLEAGALSAATLSAAPDTRAYERVLLLHSFDRDFSSHTGSATSFQTEPARLSPGPVEFFEALLEAVRFAEAVNKSAFRPPSVWEQYRGPLLGISVLGTLTALIGGLLLQRSRRRVAEEEARALARRLITAHEDERSRLARELHDDLSQRLARLAIDAALVERSLSSPEKAYVRSMREELGRLSDDVHTLSCQLHPTVLDNLGLNEALKVECERFSRRESIPAQITSFETPLGLPRELAIGLFRIAQEALRNAARHSHASRVDLSVATTNGWLRLAVTDDGVGFDPTQRRHGSLGHASMRERARLAGGELEIDSAPGRGTTVRVVVPLKGASS